jgi:hypothetical protein
MSSEPYTAIQDISWPALHTKDGDHWLPRLILAPLSIFLKTKARTDTVNRLFDSKHVNDLRLITATAFVLALVVLGLASYSAWQVYDLDWNLKTGTTDAQQHIQRLVHAGALFFKLFAPALAIFGAVLTWAYQRGGNRLGVVDLFACEIDTTCRVVLILDTIESLRSADDDRKTLAHDSFPEAYFPILGSNSSDLQSLEAEVVVNITAFYTYIKRPGMHSEGHVVLAMRSSATSSRGT